MSQKIKIWEFRALSDVWTGDINRQNNGLKNTGMLGSIRWWFEVLVRGLGGYACDPSEKDNRCPNENKKTTESGHHCVVCELFGCTDWARKFRFEIRDENNRIKTSQIKQNEHFRFHFIPMRYIKDEEWNLLDITLRLIANYGAIGGKTSNNNQDYGRIELHDKDLVAEKTLRDIENYIQLNKWHKIDHNAFDWASLQYFWFIKNNIISKKHIKNIFLYNKNNNDLKWMLGEQGTSKKYFTFKKDKRSYGFVKPEWIKKVEFRDFLKKKFRDKEFFTGEEIKENLFKI